MKFTLLKVILTLNYHWLDPLKEDRNSSTFKMELFATIGNGRVYNQWTVVFPCCCGNSTIFACKIRIGWKWPCLKGGIRYDFLFCRHVFTFFRKRPLLSVLLTFYFIAKINYKNETGIIVYFIFGVLLTEATINICSEKCC